MRLAVSLYIAAVLLMAAGCDTTEAQQAFDAQAFNPPNGTGNDDWRVGPLFETAAFVLEAPTPEPVAAGELVSLTLSVLEPAAFSSVLRVETTFDVDGNGRIDTGEAAITLGFVDYRGERQLFAQFDPSRSDPTRGGRAVIFPRGAEYRVRVFSGREIVTYGDLRLAP